MTRDYVVYEDPFAIMRVNYECGRCHKKLVTALSDAGKTTLCQYCSKLHAIPGFQEYEESLKMTEQIPEAEKFRTVEYLEKLAESHSGIYDRDIRICCAWAARRIKNDGDAFKQVVDAIADVHMHVLPCMECGTLVVVDQKIETTLCVDCGL